MSRTNQSIFISLFPFQPKPDKMKRQNRFIFIQRKYYFYGFLKTDHWLMELFDALLSRWEADLFLRSSLASLASFCLWAKILAYSAVAWRFFSARLRLRASLCLLRCNMIGVTKRWTFGALYFCFLPSLAGSGRLITYWHTLSSFDKLNNFLKK